MKSIVSFSLAFVISSSALTAQAVRPDTLGAHPATGRVPAPPGSTVPGIANAHRTSVAPVLDGSDHDPIWQRVEPITGFRQFVPTEDGEPSLRTEARVAYDDNNLYVLVRAFDPHPDSIVALLSRRDVLTASDRILVVIDAYHDRRTGVMLIVNPAGVKVDQSLYNDFTEDLSWDGVWDVATAIDSLGWIAEFRIPFSQLRFTAAAAHTFGFTIGRDIARYNERVSWPLYRPSRVGTISQLGTLAGLAGIAPSSRFELLPYVVAKSLSERRPDTWGRKEQLSAGADLKYGVTSNLTLDATVNPDFGQVESDPAVLNLTAFETQFEERRPFFQEGVGLFKCGGPCEGIFYTRRIGRAPQLASDPRDPTATTILGAAKLTGRLGRGVSVGLVEALTRREVGAAGTTIEPRTNYLVGRAYKELRQGRSGAGIMVTAVNRDLDGETENVLRRSAYTTLVQGFHRFANNQFELMGYSGFNRVDGTAQAIARTQRSSVHYYQRPDHDEKRGARRYDSTLTSLSGNVTAVAFQKLAGTMRYSTVLRNATPGVEINDLGFVPLVNDRSIRNTLLFQTAKPGARYRRLMSQLYLSNYWTTGGMRTGSAAGVFAEAELPNSWTVGSTSEFFKWGGVNCVTCARGGPAVRQSPGFYTELEIEGDPRRVLVPEFQLEWAREDEGRSYMAQVDVELEARAGGRFSIEASPELERRRDDQQWIENFGHFLSDTTHYTFATLEQTTLSIQLRANFTATRNLSFQLYAEPFVSSGSFSNWRELDQPRAERYEDRYRSYSTANPPGFNVKSFNSNIVARWEYRPGSTIFLVWQQGRQQDELNPGTFEFRRDYRDLFRAHPNNTFLIKASYWFNP